MNGHPPGLQEMTREEQQRRERMQAEQQAVRAETGGMTLAFIALQPLDHVARRRALDWLALALAERDPEPPF